MYMEPLHEHPGYLESKYKTLYDNILLALAKETSEVGLSPDNPLDIARIRMFRNPNSGSLLIDVSHKLEPIDLFIVLNESNLSDIDLESFSNTIKQTWAILRGRVNSALYKVLNEYMSRNYITEHNILGYLDFTSKYASGRVLVSGLMKKRVSNVLFSISWTCLSKGDPVQSTDYRCLFSASTGLTFPLGSIIYFSNRRDDYPELKDIISDGEDVVLFTRSVRARVSLRSLGNLVSKIERYLRTHWRYIIAEEVIKQIHKISSIEIISYTPTPKLSIIKNALASLLVSQVKRNEYDKKRLFELLVILSTAEGVSPEIAIAIPRNYLAILAKYADKLVVKDGEVYYYHGDKPVKLGLVIDKLDETRIKHIIHSIKALSKMAQSYRSRSKSTV
jgi:hypothetical protein